MEAFSKSITGLDNDLASFLEEVYEFGVDHDSRTKNHTEKMLNITPDTGLFLSITIQAVRARRVLEIGTSNGYSTLWIADALRQTNGRVVTVEVSELRWLWPGGISRGAGFRST